MPTKEKEQIVETTTARLQGVQGVYLADLSGMTVESVSRLRRKLSETNAGIEIHAIRGVGYLLRRLP